ncbi:MAG: hypothetical protein ACREXY_04370 [Gammaproteobacteria bacterium]
MGANKDSELARRNAELKRELTAMVERINDSLVMAMDLSDQIEEMRVRNAELEKINREDLNAYFNSMAYRTGSSIVGAFRRLGLPLSYQGVRSSYRRMVKVVRFLYRPVRSSYRRVIRVVKFLFRLVLRSYRLINLLLARPIASRKVSCKPGLTIGVGTCSHSNSANTASEDMDSNILGKVPKK